MRWTSVSGWPSAVSVNPTLLGDLEGGWRGRRQECRGVLQPELQVLGVEGASVGTISLWSKMKKRTVEGKRESS